MDRRNIQSMKTQEPRNFGLEFRLIWDEKHLPHPFTSMSLTRSAVHHIVLTDNPWSTYLDYLQLFDDGPRIHRLTWKVLYSQYRIHVTGLLPRANALNPEDDNFDYLKMTTQRVDVLLNKGMLWP